MAKVDKTGPKEFICPGCGAVMKNTAFNPITETCGAKLVDGWLCKDCASKLRIKYPMYYEKDKKYFYEKKGDSYVRVKSEDGGRPVLTAIKNELFYTDEYSIINNSTTSYTEHLNFDPLAKLTSSQVRAELASIGSYREETRQKFAGAKNAFEVLEVMSMPKLKPLRVGLPNIKRYKGAIAVAGIVRLGAFRKGDVVEIPPWQRDDVGDDPHRKGIAPPPEPLAVSGIRLRLGQISQGKQHRRRRPRIR